MHGALMAISGTASRHPQCWGIPTLKAGPEGRLRATVDNLHGRPNE